jgi:hypothetical protein
LSSATIFNNGAKYRGGEMIAVALILGAAMFAVLMWDYFNQAI